MNILMTGGTGFIGKRLVNALTKKGHHIYILTRTPKKYHDTEQISYISYNYPMKRLPFIHAMINLAGESLFGYWTDNKKKHILDSRIQATEKLTSILMSMETKPEVFISGSAVGYYGSNNEKIFTEATTTPGSDFLSSVCTKWEAAAHMAEDMNIRTVYTRFGVVLDKEEGAFPMMALPFKFGVGGKVGDGHQYLSWIHIHDCVGLLIHALMNKKINGPLNVTAPYPIQNKEFTHILAKQLWRPAFLHVPNKMFELTLGEMSQLMTKGQYVLPQKAIDTKYTFRYKHINDAIEAIYQK